MYVSFRTFSNLQASSILVLYREISPEKTINAQYKKMLFRIFFSELKKLLKKCCIFLLDSKDSERDTNLVRCTFLNNQLFFQMMLLKIACECCLHHQLPLYSHLWKRENKSLCTFQSRGVSRNYLFHSNSKRLLPSLLKQHI